MHPDGIIYVADITNLRRNLFFCTQLLALQIPIIILLNMVDLAQDDIVDADLLEKNMGVHKVIPFSAAKRIGIDTLKNTLLSFVDRVSPKHIYMTLSDQYKKLIYPLSEKIQDLYQTSDAISQQLSFSLLCNRKQLEYLHLDKDVLTDIVSIKTRILDGIDKDMKSHLKTMESDLRYGYIDAVLSSSDYKGMQDITEETTSEKIDRILTHKWFGPIIYVGILYFIFQSIFTWATIPMDYIDGAIGSFGNFVHSIMPEGLLRDLTVDGIIAGVGAIVIFLPQILLLMFFMILYSESTKRLLRIIIKGNGDY